MELYTNYIFSSTDKQKHNTFQGEMNNSRVQIYVSNILYMNIIHEHNTFYDEMNIFKNDRSLF